MNFHNQKDVALMIVPTGVGASVGGYAGDASKYAQKISQNIKLIVNPNIVNAAVFSGITDNMFYVEGWAIEQFVKGNLGLFPSSNNKIGVVFDRAIPQNVLNVHLNTINAIKTVYPIDIIGYEITEQDVGVEFFCLENGISSGSVKRPETLLKSAQKMIEQGAQAIAVVCFFEEPPVDDYEKGEGVDVVGGVEAVISHYLTEKLLCPCVHAPAFGDISITSELVNPKVSAEYITPTFLPCLLFGLKNAPLLIDLSKKEDLLSSVITNKNLHSIAVPFNSMGSSIVFDAIKNNISVYAITENKTVLDIDKFSIGKEDFITDLKTYDDYAKMFCEDLN